MATNQKISDMTIVTPDGTEYVEVVISPYTPGTNRRVTSQSIADLGSGGGGTSIPFGSTSGTNSYSATMSPVVAAYVDGDMYHIRVGNSSTSTVTFDLGPGAKKAFVTSGTQAQGGYFIAGVDYLLVYKASLDSAAGGFQVVNELIHGLMNFRGAYTSGGSGLYPAAGGSGPAAAIRHGDAFVMADSDTLGTRNVNMGDLVFTGVDAPGQTEANWFIIPGYESLRKTRPVTGTGAIVQTDDNSLIIFNSATPFNFTLDQLTANSKASFLNIGAGAVTFVAGSGVTITGLTVLGGALGSNFPSAFVFYHTATTPRIATGSRTQAICLVCSDESSAITTGIAKITFRMPYAMTITSVRATLTTAQASGSIFTVDINESGGSILSTKLTIDNTEKTSTTAATPAVISDASLADDSEITVDVDQIGNGSAAGLKVWLIGV